jgi:UDP-3-O-[3-hydroxymyristoyl] glucosamine N-acyltransferase
MAQGEDRYQLVKGQWYKGDRVVIARSSRIGANVLLGSGCVIGENVTIENAVLGSNCHIGK